MWMRHQTSDAAGPGDARVPEETCVYAVGDVHGMADALAEINRRIAEDARHRGAERNVLIYVGDYVDRGPKSFEVVDMLVDDPLQGFETHFLKGNHEDFLLKFLDTRGGGGDLWLRNGGRETLESYGLDVGALIGGGIDFSALAAAFRDAMPPDHLAFLRGLELLHKEGDYVFAHAGVRPGVPLDSQDPADLLWIREGFLDCESDLGLVVVHGHTISREPDVRHNRIGIDTGAFMSGHLTCLVLQGDRREWIVV